MTAGLGRYAFEVLLAYAGTLALLAALVGLSVLAARRMSARLDAAERRRRDG